MVVLLRFLLVLATATIRTVAVIPPECLQSLLYNLTSASGLTSSFCLTGSAAVATAAVNRFAKCSQLSATGLRVGAHRLTVSIYLELRYTTFAHCALSITTLLVLAAANIIACTH